MQMLILISVSCAMLRDMSLVNNDIKIIQDKH